MQFVVHPALSFRTPSSHISEPTTLPSPQIAAQVIGINPSQVHPGSRVHTELQPSLFAVFPSSHVSTPFS